MDLKNQSEMVVRNNNGRLMNDLVHNLLAPWHLAFDATLLIGFLSWVYFHRGNKAGS